MDNRDVEERPIVRNLLTGHAIEEENVTEAHFRRFAFDAGFLRAIAQEQKPYMRQAGRSLHDLSGLDQRGQVMGHAVRADIPGDEFAAEPELTRESLVARLRPETC